ncbi:MAG: aerotolerance regulator BatC, partial [Deltaproteobacteria bacterium]|nr:aerotolerance regulator BatC [Deltaproteobacteria bacterium]
EPGSEADGGASEPDGGVSTGMDRDRAEKLLDSMKQNEKNLQLWRFQQKRPRRANEKDW